MVLRLTKVFRTLLGTVDLIRKNRTIRLISVATALVVMSGNFFALAISSANGLVQSTSAQIDKKSEPSQMLNPIKTGLSTTQSVCEVSFVPDIPDSEIVSSGKDKPDTDFFEADRFFYVPDKIGEFYDPAVVAGQSAEIYRELVKKNYALKKKQAAMAAKKAAEKKAAEEAAKKKKAAEEAAKKNKENAVQTVDTVTSSSDTLSARIGGKKQVLPVKEMLARVVSAEVNSSMSVEAIKAQVVATHSYILYYNMQGQSPSVGSSSYSKDGKVYKAVEAVFNKVMYYNGKPVYAPYCASTCGRTENSEYAWSSPLHYLKSVESKYDKNSPGYKKTRTFSQDKIKDKIKSSLGITLSGDPDTWFTFLDGDTGKTPGGYVNYIKVGGKKVRGRAVSDALGLRSNCFTVSVSGNKLKITTYGFGHGVGLSQWGAHFYAKNDGWDYIQILTHYFTDVTVK